MTALTIDFYFSIYFFCFERHIARIQYVLLISTINFKYVSPAKLYVYVCFI